MIHINFIPEVTPKPNKQYTPEQLVSCQTLATFDYLVHGLINAGAVPNEFKAHAGPYLLPITAQSTEMAFEHMFVDTLGQHYKWEKDNLFHLVHGSISPSMNALGDKPDYAPHPKFGRLPSLKTYPAAIGMPKNHIELLHSLEEIAKKFASGLVTVSTPAGTEDNPTDTWKGPPINPQACAYFSTKTNPEAKLALYLGTDDPRLGTILDGKLPKIISTNLACPGVSLHIACNHGDTQQISIREKFSRNYFEPPRYRTGSVDIRHGLVQPAELLESILLTTIIAKGVSNEAAREWKPKWVRKEENSTS